MNLKNVFLMAVMLSSCTNGNAEKIAKEKTDSISPVECVNDSVVALNNEQDLVPEGAKLLHQVVCQKFFSFHRHILLHIHQEKQSYYFHIATVHRDMT